MEELLDLTVIGSRPSAAGPELLDVELDGRFQMHHRDGPRSEAQAPTRPATH
jgi:hypothetical protein